MGSTRIMRGVNGAILWSQGLLFTSGTFERVVAASPAALAQAREFNHKNRRGTVSFAIGLRTWVTSLFIAGRHPTDTNYAVATVLGFPAEDSCSIAGEIAMRLPRRFSDPCFCTTATSRDDSWLLQRMTSAPRC